jgi:hypothetical protein
MMPTEKTSTRAMTGKRILNLPVGNYNQLSTADGFPGANGWTALNSGTLLYAENYFDLSGYELDDLTLVPEFLQLQDGLPYFGNGPLSLEVYDVVSQERLDPIDFVTYALSGDYPGSPGSTEDWTQILMCNTRFMTPQTDFTFADLYLPATSGSFGSLEPTAVQKLWVYRIVNVRGVADAQTLQIPASRFVLGAEIIKEDDLEYMMRLKRSYELSTQG